MAERAVSGTADKDKKLIHKIVQAEDSRSATYKDNDLSKNEC